MSRTKDPTNPSQGSKDKDVQSALRVFEDNRDQYNKYLSGIRAIVDLDEETFEVAEPIAARRLPQYLLRQIIENFLSKITRPSSTYHSESATERQRVAVRDGIEWIMQQGGFVESLNSKPSAYRDSMLYGDGFIRIGADDSDRPSPIRFDNITPGMVWTDTNATVMRSKRGTRQVTRMNIVYAYDYDQAVQDWPGKRFSRGEVPREQANDFLDDIDKTIEQSFRDKEQEVEICHHFDIGGDTPVYVVFAGKSLTVLSKLRGDDYPFVMDGKPYIPVIDLRWMDASKGFFNKGVGQLFYKMSIARRQLINKSFNQAMNSTDDIKVLSVDKGQGGEAFKRVQDAEQRKAKGERGWIISDFDKEMVVTTLEPPQFNAALDTMYQILDRDIRRFKINLDSLDIQPGERLGQTLEQERSSNEVVEEYLDKNVDEFEFAHMATIDFVKKFVPDGDPTPIPTTITLAKARRDDAGEIVGLERDAAGNVEREDFIGFTLGLLKELVTENDFTVEMNTISGIKQSDLRKQAKAVQLMQLAPQNAMIVQKGIEAFAAGANVEIPEDAFGQQAQVEPEAGASQAGIKQVQQAVAAEANPQNA